MFFNNPFRRLAHGLAGGPVLLNPQGMLGDLLGRPAGDRVSHVLCVDDDEFAVDAHDARHGVVYVVPSLFAALDEVGEEAAYAAHGRGFSMKVWGHPVMFASLSLACGFLYALHAVFQSSSHAVPYLMPLSKIRPPPGFGVKLKY